MSRDAWRKVGLPAFAIGCAMMSLSGCATLRSERDALARYERTREELELARRGQLNRPSPENYPAEKKAPLELADFAPGKLKDTVQRIAGRGPSQTDAERLYAEGKTLYEEALALREQNDLSSASPKFIAAAAKFEKAAKRLPQSTLEQNALFYASEAYFCADRYVKASDSYERLVKAHPNSRYLDEIQQRRFAIAQYWLEIYNTEQPSALDVNLIDRTRPKMNLFGHAMRVFDRIRLDDPTGKLADDATLAMANAHFKEGNYIKADELYTDLRKTFPNSEHQFTAHFVGLKSKVLSYRGADYGGTILDEAAQLLETTRKQFPVESEQERDYLLHAYGQIRYAQAEREWLTGQYFDQKAEYGAAKFYYSIVLNEFADTPFAEKTQERVAQIGGLPEVPAQRFPWLVDLFPREESVRPLMATDKPKTTKR